MKSFKHLVILVVFSLLATLSLSIIFNMIFVSHMAKELRLLGAQIQDLHSKYLEMEMPLRVFNNILSQTISDEDKDTQRKEKVINAYEDNRIKFTSQITQFKDKNIQIYSTSEFFTHNFFVKHTISFNELQKHISNINTHIQVLTQVCESSLKKGSQYRNSDLEELTQIYQIISNDIDGLTSSYNNLDNLFLKQYITCNVILFSVLLVGTLLLTLLLFKMLGRDLSYILKGFHMLNLHNYNENNLPQMKATFLEEKEIESMVTSVLKEQKFLSDVKAFTSSGYIIDDILEDLFHSIKTALRTDRVGIAFVDYTRKKIIAEHGISNYGDVRLGPGFEVNFKDTTLTNLLNTKQPIILHDLSTELALRPKSSSLCLLEKEGIQSNMILPLTINNSVFAFLFFSSQQKNNYDQKALQLAQNIALEISAVLDKSYLTKTIFSKITNTFSELVDKKDNESGGHILRMVQYSVILANALLSHPDGHYKVSNRFVREIENNASSHDIGKVGIPDDILKKPGKLTEQEWLIMKTHTTIGGEIFESLKDSLKIFNRDFYKMAEDIARYHHEKWDGSGYPKGIIGQDIPLAARIVAIADVFDALTSKRVYKEPFSFEESVEIIRQSSGSHLDPILVKVFNEQLPNFKKVYDLN